MGDSAEEVIDSAVQDKYRGPPPRKDLVPSPNKERDWKGNDWFNEMSTDMNGTNGTTNGTNGHGVCEEKSSNGTGIAPGLRGEYIDPHLKAQRDYDSDYAKLALQGGHKGLLSMNAEETKIPTLDDYGRRQRGCDNISAYNKIALQGGHKDLLKIEGGTGESNGSPTKSTKVKTQSPRKCGDWYGGENGVSNNNNTPSRKPTSPEPRTITPPIRDQRRSHGNCIVPGGDQEPQRFGKKRFNNQSQRQEAPFATNY